MFYSIRQTINRRLTTMRYRRDAKRIANHQEGRIAITGCGRSGTKYTATLFNAFGYSVGHEYLGMHGISSWCLAPDTSDRHIGPSPRDIATLNLRYAHQVRHPLQVIASMATASSGSWQFAAKYIPIHPQDTLALKCMKYWYYWNLLAEQRAVYTYRVEDIDKVLPELFEIGGFDTSRLDPAVVQDIRKDVNRRDHDRMDWESLQLIDSHLTEQIMKLATRYGYEVC